MARAAAAPTAQGDSRNTMGYSGATFSTRTAAAATCTMNLKQIRYFVAVAEEGSFTRAAAKLCISQPPLSQQIKLLESELDVQLFERTTRGTRLTPAGEALLLSSRRILSEMQMAREATTKAYRGESGSIRIGVISSALYCLFPGLLPLLQTRFPEVEIEIREMNSRSQITALEDGRIDLGLLHPPSASDDALELAEIHREPLRLAVSLTHPARPHVSGPVALRDWKETPFIFAARETSPLLFDRMVGICVRAGFSPNIQYTSGHLVTILQMVRLNLGIALLPESLIRNEGHGIAGLALEDPAAEISIYAACNPATASPLVRNVLAAMNALETPR